MGSICNKSSAKSDSENKMKQGHEGYGIVNTKSLTKRVSRPIHTKQRNSYNLNWQNNQNLQSQRQQRLQQNHKQVKQNDKETRKDKKNDQKQNNGCSVSLPISLISIMTLSLVSIFILPPTPSVSSTATASISSITTIFFLLILYLFDLSNCKDGFYNMIWISFIVNVFVLSWEYSCQWNITSNSYNVNAEIQINLQLWTQTESWCYCVLTKCIVWIHKIMFFFSMACWFTLQCQWMNQIYKSYMTFIKQMFHFNLSISFAFLSSFTPFQLYEYYKQYYIHNHYEIYNHHQMDEYGKVIHYEMSNVLWSIMPFLYIISLVWSYKRIMIYFNLNSNRKATSTNSTLQSLSPSSSQIYSKMRNNHNNNHHHRSLKQKDQQQHIHPQKVTNNNNDYSVDLHQFPLYYFTILLAPLILYLLTLPLKWNNNKIAKNIIITNENDRSIDTSYCSDNYLLSWIGILNDIILLTVIPYHLIQYHLQQGNIDVTKTTSSGSKGTTTLLAIITITQILIYRYIIPLCLVLTRHIHYHHHDNTPWQEYYHKEPSKKSMHILINCMFLIVFIGYYCTAQRMNKWVLGSSRFFQKNYHQELIRNTVDKKIAINNSYYDDDDDDDTMPIMILVLIISSLFLSIILVSPWYFFIYVHIFGLGFGLFYLTSKPTYSIVSLIVGMIVLLGIFTQRFHMIDHNSTSNNSNNNRVWIIPGLLKLSIEHFNILYSIGVYIFNAIYLYLQKNEKTSAIITKIDALGFMLLSYNIFVMLLEESLLFESVGTSRHGYYLYSDIMVIITSVWSIEMARRLKRQAVITKISYLLSVSLSIGKCLASITKSDIRSSGDLMKHLDMISSSFMVTQFLFILGAPFTLISCKHFTDNERNHFGKKPRWLLSQNTSICIALYCAIILPISIAYSFSVLWSFIRTVMNGFSETHYSRSLNMTERMSYFMMIWGSIVLSVLNYHFPTCGATWKKGALCSFMFGSFLCIISSTFSIFDDNDIFIPLSNVAFTKNHDCMKGTWGLIMALVSFILPLSGPLALPQWSRHDGVGDKARMARFTIFCLMFSIGSSWFIVLRLYGNLSTLDTMLDATSSILISFFYTAAIVCNMIKTEKRSDVAKMGKISVFVALLCTVCSTITFNHSNGPLESIFVPLLWVLYSFSFGLSIRFSSQRSMTMRALGNLCFIKSWLVSTLVVYGYFGIASIGTGTNYDQILGIPTSIPFTVLSAFPLVLLEVEPKQKQFSPQKPPIFGVTLSTLRNKHRQIRPVIAAGVTFILASLYVIFIRGYSNRWLDNGVHITHEHVFQSHYGTESRINYISNLEDAPLIHAYHERMLARASKLAASGYWTSNSAVGPTIHLVGLMFLLPTWYFIISFLFNPASGVSYSALLRYLPSHIIPFALCKGIPSLTATAFVGCTLSLYLYHVLKHKDWKTKMKSC